MKRLFFYGVIYVIAFIILIPCSNAQEENPRVDFSDDSLYIKARNLAYEQETAKARQAALALLERNPLHHDASVLIARLYAWENLYDSARIYIQYVTGHVPNYYDALLALTDIEIWEGNYEQAVETADIALAYHPDDEMLILRKARALFFLGLKSESKKTIDYLLEINPDNQEAIDLLRLVSAPGFYHYRENSYLLAGYYRESFNNPFKRDFHSGSAGYSRYTGIGPLTAKVNFANSFFDGSGLTRYPSLQYELESYPRLSEEAYLLLNYAFSRGAVFPGHRAAFELFRKLPGGFEASLGLRFLYWDTSYFFYTGSAGKYLGNMWFSLRPYIFPDNDGISSSWFFNARKFFKSADDFAGIIIGYGISPDDTYPDFTEKVYLNSVSAGVEGSTGITSKILVRGSLRYEYEEFETNRFRNRWSFNLGLRYYL